MSTTRFLRVDTCESRSTCVPVVSRTDSLIKQKGKETNKIRTRWPRKETESATVLLLIRTLTVRTLRETFTKKGNGWFVGAPKGNVSRQESAINRYTVLLNVDVYLGRCVFISQE